MFGVIGVKESHVGHVNSAEVIYIAAAVGVCFLMGLLNVSITDIIDINGAVIGFFFIYFLPAMLHIKCMYFSKGKLPLPLPQKEEILTDDNGKANEDEKEERESVKEVKKRKESEI
jgi:hypothetical protein